MALDTALMQRLGLERPIIQAPMAGGGDTPELVTAVCEAGGLGSIGCAYSTPEQIEAAASAVRARTNRPFGLNLFAPLERPPLPDQAESAVAPVAAYHRALGLPPPDLPDSSPYVFEDQLAAALDGGASVISFAFGIPPEAAIEAVKARGMLLMGRATTVEEALALEDAGFDAVVLQGIEAGGHRGGFMTDLENGLIGLIALVPQVADATRLPVVASGGIMDGRGVAAALLLGAQAVQMGTAFLTCAESGIPKAYRDAILDARENETRLTRVFSGRPARGIVNRFMSEMAQAAEGCAEAILPFPLQNELTRPLRKEAARQGRAEYLSLWAGQGVRLSRRQGAAELMASLHAETQAAIDRLSDGGKNG